MDGINIDIEQAVESESPEYYALTRLVNETTEAFHREIPGSQVNSWPEVQTHEAAFYTGCRFSNKKWSVHFIWVWRKNTFLTVPDPIFHINVAEHTELWLTFICGRFLETLH